MVSNLVKYLLSILSRIHLNKQYIPRKISNLHTFSLLRILNNEKTKVYKIRSTTQNKHSILHHIATLFKSRHVELLNETNLGGIDSNMFNFIKYFRISC